MKVLLIFFSFSLSQVFIGFKYHIIDALPSVKIVVPYAITIYNTTSLTHKEVFVEVTLTLRLD